MTIRERWLADGFEFTNGDYMDVEYRSGQLGVPAARGSNATVANRTGEVWRPKVHEAGAFSLELWFGTYQRQAQALWDDILRAVVQPHRLVTWRRITAAGETRTCAGEVIGALLPTAVGQSAYRASIEVHVPRGYWRGEQTFSVSTPTSGAATSREVDLTPFAASTAAMEELTYRLDGHLVAPKVTDLTALGRGESLSYAATIPAGQALTLSAGDWSATGSGGLAVNTEAINYTGDRYLTVAATPPGTVPRLRLTAGEIGTAGKLTVSGYRSYLC